MNLSQAKEKSSPASKADGAADPFASDIFADLGSGETGESKAVPKPKEEKPAWIRRIPKVPRQSVDWEKLWRGLPPDFLDELPRRLANSLSEYLSPDAERLIEFLPMVGRESPAISENGMAWWVRIGVENSDAELALEVDDGFAVWLIDGALGEIGDKFPIRVLTPSEIAVLEFLAINLTHETNTIVSTPLFTFRSLGRKAPDWIKRENDGETNSLSITTFQSVHGIKQNVIKLCLTPAALRVLQASENKLLKTPTRRPAMWNSLAKRVENVRCRVFLGEVRVTLADVAGLEIGDVVLPENYGFSPVDDGLWGKAGILVGDGNNVAIHGTFQPSETEPSEGFDASFSGDDNGNTIRRIKSHPLRFSIERIENLEEIQILEKSMPHQNVDLTRFC